MTARGGAGAAGSGEALDWAPPAHVLTGKLGAAQLGLVNTRPVLEKGPPLLAGAPEAPDPFGGAPKEHTIHTDSLTSHNCCMGQNNFFDR